MGKGILSGVIWGAVVGGISTAFLSLYVPMKTATVAQKAESESVEPVAPSAVDASETAETPVTAAPVETAEATATETVEATSVPTTKTAASDPVVETPATAEVTEGAQEAPSEQAEVVQAEEVAPTVSAEAEVTAETETASAVNTQVAEQPEAEKPEVAIEIASASAAQSAPATPATALPTISSQSDPETATAAEPKRLKAPEVNDRQLGQVVSPAALSTPVEEVAPDQTTQEVATEQAPAKESTAETTPETVSADTPIAVPIPKIDNPVKSVVTNRLPSVTAPETPSATEDTEVASEEDPEVPAEIDPNAGALERFAAEADIPEGASLFSIVLVDAGADGMARDKLLELDLPVTFALDPSSSGAAEAMAAYRSAGFEVVAMPDDLPVTASPSDVEVALGGYFDVLKEAVGVMDPLDGRIQSNRSLLQPVLGAIRDSGHGLLTYDRGLNTAQQAARRENIPAASVYRVLDAELENAPLIKRYLDRAAFTANKDGSVVVVGRSYEDTVTALIEWGLARKDGDLAIVPVSAVMSAGAN